MPAEVWWFLIAAVLVAVVFAIWKGRGLNLRKGKEGFEISVKERVETAPPQAGISIGEGLVIKGSTTGAIAGVMTQGGGAASVPAGAKIDVLKQGEISESTTGDIAGVKQDRESKGRR
jgi:hypothetical protein